MTQIKKAYVDNQRFYDEIVKRKAALKEAEEKGLPKPKINDYIGKCLTDIATNFAKRPLYYGRTYKDEMIQDAIVNCVRYFDTFDPERTKNPFSYFSQCCYYSFLATIVNERDQAYTRSQIAKNVNIDKFTSQEHDNSEIANEYIEYLNSLQKTDYSKYYEKKPKLKREHINELQKFMDSDIDVFDMVDDINEEENLIG